MGMFETSDTNSARWNKPVQVPSVKDDIFSAACEMAEDMPGWTVTETDKEALRIVASKKNGFLGGVSTITVTVEGPAGMPNSSTHCRSESSGALLSRDKGNVAEFIQKFRMRVN